MKRPALQLRRREPVRRGLVRIVNGLVSAALRVIARPTRDRAEDAHQVRLTIKFLRALLRLLRPVAGQDFLRGEKARLRRAAGRLARLRDELVNREVLGHAMRRAKPRRDRQALERVLAALAAAGPSAARMRQRLEIALQRAAADLRETQRTWSALRLGAEGWPALGPGLCHTYREGRNLMQAALAEGREEDYHAWRKRVKSLHYQLELLAGMGPRKLPRLIKRLKELGARLGDENDLAVLKARLRQPGEFPGLEEEIARVTARLEKAQVRWRRRIGKLGDRCYRRPPKAFAKLLALSWEAWARR